MPIAYPEQVGTNRDGSRFAGWLGSARMESLKGHLLLASPALFDPNFRRTVVLNGEHSDEGAMGVVLNRPSEATVSDAIPELADVVEENETVWLGGPVQQSAVMLVAE